jgi:hypothetical protein
MKTSTLLLCLCWLSITAFAQSGSKPFEGSIDVTVIQKQDPGFQQKSLEALKKLGWTDLVKTIMADSFCTRYYIKQDSVWAEVRRNGDEKLMGLIFRQAFMPT